MINLYSFLHALKLSWIKRIIYKNDLQWLTLLNEVNSLSCVVWVVSGVRKTILRAVSGKKYFITGKLFAATAM